MRETKDRNIEKYKIFQESGKNVWCEDKGCPSGTVSTGSIPQRLNDNLRTIEVGIPAELIQRCSLSGFARILRKALEM